MRVTAPTDASETPITVSADRNNCGISEIWPHCASIRGRGGSVTRSTSFPRDPELCDTPTIRSEGRYAAADAIVQTLWSRVLANSQINVIWIEGDPMSKISQ